MAESAKKSVKPKIMDAVHPQSSAPSPSASGRPIIVSNHSYIKNDPMLNVQSDAPKTEEPAAAPDTKTTEKPSSEPKLQLVGEKKIQPITTEEKPVDEAPGSDSTTETTEKEDLPTEASTSDETIEQEPEPAVITEPEAPEEPEPAEPVDPAPLEVPVEEPAKPDLGGAQLAPQPTQNEAEQQAEDEAIEHMITAGTYAVPINRKKKRRSWIMFTIVTVLVLVVVGLDVLADMGVITLPFGIPSTDFFVK